MGLKGKLSIILLIVLLSFSPAKADAATVGDISKQLICQCGCNTVLSNCECGTQEAMTALIEQKLAQGQTEDEIIQSFVAQYGEQVLASPPASPPKKDFNLVLWVLTPIAILGGGGAIYMALRKWGRRGRQSRAGRTRRK